MPATVIRPALAHFQTGRFLYFRMRREDALLAFSHGRDFALMRMKKRIGRTESRKAMLGLFSPRSALIRMISISLEGMTLAASQCHTRICRVRDTTKMGMSRHVNDFKSFKRLR